MVVFAGVVGVMLKYTPRESLFKSYYDILLKSTITITVVATSICILDPKTTFEMMKCYLIVAVIAIGGFLHIGYTDKQEKTSDYLWFIAMITISVSLLAIIGYYK